jgi:hypothetical protein
LHLVAYLFFGVFSLPTHDLLLKMATGNSPSGVASPYPSPRGKIIPVPVPVRLLLEEGEQNPWIENPPLRTKIITRMISPWISHPGKSPGSRRDRSFQISYGRGGLLLPITVPVRRIVPDGVPVPASFLEGLGGDMCRCRRQCRRVPHTDAATAVGSCARRPLQPWGASRGHGRRCCRGGPCVDAAAASGWPCMNRMK